MPDPYQDPLSEHFRQELDHYSPAFDEAAWVDMQQRLEKARRRPFWYVRNDWAAILMLVFLVGGVYLDLSFAARQEVRASTVRAEGSWTARLAWPAESHRTAFAAHIFADQIPPTAGQHSASVSVEPPANELFGSSAEISAMAAPGQPPESALPPAKTLARPPTAKRNHQARALPFRLAPILPRRYEPLPHQQDSLPQVYQLNRWLIGLEAVQLTSVNFQRKFEQTDLGYGAHISMPVSRKLAASTGVRFALQTSESLITRPVSWSRLAGDNVPFSARHFDQVQYITYSRLHTLELPLQLRYIAHPQRRSTLMIAGGMISHVLLREFYQMRIDPSAAINLEPFSHRYHSIHQLNEAHEPPPALALASSLDLRVGIRHQLAPDYLLDLEAFVRKNLQPLGHYQITPQTVGLAATLQIGFRR